MSARRALALTAMLGLGACAALRPADACAPGDSRAQVAELYFGRNVGDRVGVSDADFARFVDEELTPRFPEGLTLQDSLGQWRDGEVLVREPGKVLLVVLPGRADDRERLAAAAEAYKRRFDQKSVLRVVRTACVAF